MLLLAALLLPASMFIGNAAAELRMDARDVAFREHVAGLFAADCMRVRVPVGTRAPNATQRRVLGRICSCSVAHIRSSDISYADSQDLVTWKVHQAQTACLNQVYGRRAGSANPSH